jgi:hypothetical protein
MLGVGPRPFSWLFFPFSIKIYDFIDPKYRVYAIATLPILHVVEYFFLLRPLVYRHRVPKEKKWPWFRAYLVCGFPTYFKFQELVREESARVGLDVSIGLKRAS